MRRLLPDRLTACMVAFYLGAIVVANFVVAAWGQAALPLTAWVLIPFDLVTRDVLHERWSKQRGGWVLRMALLIATGSILTAALSWEARRVALASFLAFGAAGAVNTLVYHLLRERGRMLRMNTSNLFAAIVDSIVFPVVAFWPLVDPWLCAGQAGSKFVGGIFWSWMFVSIIWRRRRPAIGNLYLTNTSDGWLEVHVEVDGIWRKAIRTFWGGPGEGELSHHVCCDGDKPRAWQPVTQEEKA